ncbi:MAG: peptidoglycan DD-metalloendopeptidase family protein [Porphyromonadaceae bacterium]|nr:peptidoglycan DD-metalloendopeptidase family protein [Porphyromonadaceae bacterium]
MKKIILLFSLFFIVCSWGHQAHSQTVEQLRKERKEIQDRINATNKLLQQTQKEEKASLKKLKTLQRNLNDRRRLINSYNAEILALDRKMNQLISERTKLESQLEELKQEYAKLIQNTQMNRNSYSKLMFLLSAKNFDQTLRRARYLQEFAEFKKKQVNQIEDVKKQIELKTDSVEQNKNEKLTALKTKELENIKLKKEEGDEKVLLAELQKEEKKLAEEFRAHQRKRDQIDNRIQQVIAEEIRKAEAKRRAEEARKRQEEARRKAAEALAKKNAEGKKQTSAPTPATSTPTPPPVTKPAETPTVAKAEPKTSSESVSALTREESLLAGGFANNRGRLPWPVDRGVISGRFGTQPHPELRHVTSNNKGTYFRSPSGTNARAVYEGVVTRRFALPGSGSAVIIQHGTYRTVYGNLSSVNVREGERVSAKQVIGQIFTDEASGQAELQFQIWSGSTMLNPEGWIAR